MFSCRDSKQEHTRGFAFNPPRFTRAETLCACAGLFCAVCARDHTRSQREGNLQPKQPIVQVYGSLLNHTVIFILTQAVGGIIIHLGAERDVLVGLRGLRVHALGTVVAFTHEGLVG